VTYFDRETVSLLKTVLDRVWATLPPGERAKTSQSVLAERILKAAAHGELAPGSAPCARMSDDCSTTKWRADAEPSRTLPPLSARSGSRP
jgi:hypothetical protein